MAIMGRQVFYLALNQAFDQLEFTDFNFSVPAVE